MLRKIAGLVTYFVLMVLGRKTIWSYANQLVVEPLISSDIHRKVTVHLSFPAKTSRLQVK